MSITANEHGIWPADTAEHLVLPSKKKDRLRMPIAEIALLETPQGWVSSAGYNLSGNSGGGFALSPKWHGGWLPSRQAALASAVAYLRGSIEGKDDHPDARAIKNWIDRGCSLTEQQQEIVF